MIRRAIAAVLGIIMIPTVLLAAATIPGVYGKIAPTLKTVLPNQLPVQYRLPSGQPGLTYGISSISTAGNQMTIFQNQSQAIIDWQSFNIGSNASVYFNQQGNTSWAALNRIWDANPSQIYGRLTADGKVYLINQNGILFGPSSQVNVNGLVASSLNLSIDNFLASTLTGGSQQIPLTFSNQQGSINGQPEQPGTGFYNPSLTPGAVSNAGNITTGSFGSVFLIGPTVENSGSISTPSGQIGLVAGTDVVLESPPVTTAGVSELDYPGGEPRTTLMIQINNGDGGYTASNLAGGYLSADMGLVGMYGNIVNQNGVIQSVQAVQRGAHVELFASDTVSTGPGSVINLPVSTSPDEINSTFITVLSDVTFSGIDPSNPAVPQVYPNLILHQGAIAAPSAFVTMNAASRVYLASGSQIDVSGLWLDEPASSGIFSVQLNTYQLRDYYLQQGGVLQGQTVNISQIAGSTIGDVSGAFAGLALTAAERHTNGGTVYINVTGPTGDIIEREGALVNFSGGGIVYAAGFLDATMLLSGYKVYDIASASADLTYNSVLSSQTFTNTRFGDTRQFKGIYYGGAVPVKEYSQSYTVGNSAGILWLRASTLVLDGTILGTATNGIQQVLTANPTNAAGDLSAYGLMEAAGGTLEIGNPASGSTADFVVQSIAVSPQTTPVLSAAFQPTDALPSTNTVLSAPTLTNAGLSNLSLYANTSIMVQQGAQITLNPGGTFQAVARRIENYGGITAPGGNISLSLQTNVTSDPSSSRYVPLDERIYLAPGSSMSAAGERIDDSGAAVYSGIITSGYIAGGSISIQDQTINGDGVIISPTAVVDVSGGYHVSTSGKITGGNAGSLTLQGHALIVDGDLRARSLLGNNGGSITMTAGDIDVTAAPVSLPAGFNASSTLPANLTGKLVLASDQLSGTGFTSITLNSVNDVVLEGGVTLAPSPVKLATPAIGGGASSSVVAGTGTVTVTPDLIGASAITLSAGFVVTNITQELSILNGPMNPPSSNTLARATISPGAGVAVGPGGAVTMSAPYIDIGGSVNAPAGTIAATADYGLTLDSGATIRADGYNEAGTVSQLKWLAPNPIPKAGGSIALTVPQGDLTLSLGSLVSVNGSSPVGQTVINADGSITSVTTAGAPGTISLSAFGNLSLGGDLEGRALMAGLPGGTLSIANTNPSGTLSLSMSELTGFQKAGFDALTLASGYQLSLTGSGQVSFGRQLTLDALVIAGSGNQIALSAPWVQVQAEAVIAEATSGVTLPPTSVLAPGNASITLSGGFVDVTGSVLFSGFNSVTLTAVDDIRLSDFKYGASWWAGLLAVSGDLTLQAARVYPTTDSIFTASANGQVSILPSATPASGLGPIFSAGGSLTVESFGSGIDQEGYLAAPMGSIALSAPNGRVYLGSGSTTTTQGDAAVVYGSIQSGSNQGDLGVDAWVIIEHTGTNTSFSLLPGVPSESISLTGSEVIMHDGAVVNASGGGSIFASLFLSSYSGTNNPLVGSYVIVPGNSVAMPGSAVYLTGIKGLPAGTYSLLPALDANGNPTSYVYMPGAMIVTDLGTTISSSFKQALTPDGYPIVAGYATTIGTGIQSAVYEAYEVRPATVVLAEGDFDVQSLTAGNAGSVTAVGTKTTVLEGTIKAAALSGYNGGTIALSAATGKNSVVVEASASLPSDFTFSTPLSADDPLSGTMTIVSTAVSGNGFNTVGLGVSNLTGSAASVSASTVEIKPGAIIQAENIILGATTSITLDAGAQVLALALPGDTGQATFISPGTLSVGANAVVHASDAVNLQIGSLSLEPTAILKADHGSLNVQGSTITVYDPSVTSQPSGLFLTVNQWNNFAVNFDSIDITAVNLSVPSAPQAGSIVFDSLTGADYLAAVKETLTLDAGLVTTRVNGSDTGSTVTLAAENIMLQNTSGASNTVSASRGTGEITFQAQELEVGKGNIQLDGFSTVNMNVANDLTFRGAGEVPTGGTFRAAGVLATGGADLNISAARVTTSYYMQPAGTDPTTGEVLPPVYTAANFLIDATNRDSSGNPTGGGGTVNITPGTGTAGTTTTPGGTLAITAGEIDISTVVEVPSGQIELTAVNDINLHSGGQLLARGTTYAPGGVVSLTSTGGGAINLLSGSQIDVSAGSQGDAGNINLYAPVGGVTLRGSMQGKAAGGNGGSFSIVTNSLDTVNGINYFSALNSQLVGGGFTNALNMEATMGNITIASGQTVAGQSVTITADGGNIDLSGTINVCGSTGGAAALYAMNDLTVTGTINAYGTNGLGGNVTLGTSTGMLSLAGGTIDVSGSTTGGTVTFQALPSSMSLSGTVKGASGVVADIEDVYVNQFQGADGTGGVSTVINAAAIAQIQSDLTNLMSANSGLGTQLANGLQDGNGNVLSLYDAVFNPTGTFHLQPGVVIEQTAGDGDITLASAWNLPGWRFGGGNEPGTFTLRAAGNLNINASIVDNPTAVGSLAANTTPQPSWSINLVAGANTASANPMAVTPANGTGASTGALTVASGTTVYTEAGSIEFASGGNTVIDNPGAGYIPGGGSYNLGAYAGSIRGDVGGNLTLNGGVIESATGSIDVDIRGNLTLGWNNANTSLGAIWTTGERASSSSQIKNYATYGNGGSINLDVGGDVDGQVVSSIVWLTAASKEVSRGVYTYTILPNYASPQGILAVAGGSVSVRAGGNFEAQAGTFGIGNLTIYAGGDLEGRFLVRGDISSYSATPSVGTLVAMGNFGMPEQVVNGSLKSWAQMIEMSNAQISITAQGNVELGAVVNPDLAYGTGALSSPLWDNTYTPSSSMSLTAVTGDVNMHGTIDPRYGIFYGTMTGAFPFLPATVEIAAGGNINVMAGFTQLPAANGNLSMTAGGNIVFSSGTSWLMSDADPSLVYTTGNAYTSGFLANHASILLPDGTYVPLHYGDSVPVVISAGGDITDMDITLPKAAAIYAGGNITDLFFIGQNIQSNDVTSVTTLGNIVYGYTANADFEAIELGGPGYLAVQAGGKIDLGQSEGIQAVGNYLNPVLATGGSVIVAAGISDALGQQELSSFFDAVRSAGDQYSPLLQSDPAAAQAIIDQARADIIAPFLAFHNANAGGDITMTSSQISTAGGGTISVLATGSLDVGTSILGSGLSVTLLSGIRKNFGILTEAGGAINVFATGNVNVNEARIMTFEGGDITIWSDRGNVYAGEGDKATVNALIPKYTCKNNVCSLTFTPPTVGSGIRAVTYAPDENTPAPPIGNIYIFTPSGFIDAGQAGISGGNVTLGAMNGVLNAANISFTGQAVGLPPAAQGVSLGVLMGTSDFSKGTISSDMGSLETAKNSLSSGQGIEDVVVKWLDVQFVDFDLTSPVAGEDEQ